MKMPEEIIKENGWIQISDESAIKEVVMKILNENPQSIADYKAGKDRALGFLVGQAMKQTKGKANRLPMISCRHFNTNDLFKKGIQKWK